MSIGHSLPDRMGFHHPFVPGDEEHMTTGDLEALSDRLAGPRFDHGQASYRRGPVSAGQEALHGLAEDLVGPGRVLSEQAGELPTVEHPHLEVGGRGHRCRAPAPRVEEGDLPEMLTRTEQGERRAPAVDGDVTLLDDEELASGRTLGHQPSPGRQAH
jgi:hypothetical protein